MSNTAANKQRMHLQTDVDASDIGLKPYEWPMSITYQYKVFKRNLCKYSGEHNDIVWYNYHCNTEEHFWVLKVWNT